MNRIDKKFRQLRAVKKKAFIAYLTAGYPNISVTERLVIELEKRGADIIELGVPFSDPVADGKVIQQASYEALKKGITLKKILSMVGDLRKKTQVPIAAMSYFNPILSYGTSRFISDAVKSGLDAVVIPDLPPEEEIEFRQEANRRGLEVVLFMSPTTSVERSRAIARKAKGFIYFVSLAGVTGARKNLPKELSGQLHNAKRIAGKIPVCAGFGISTRQHVHSVSSHCDGVIVGSAIIKKITENLGKSNIIRVVGDFVESLTR